MSTTIAPSPRPAASPAIRRWRIGLILLGVAILVIGGIILLDTVKPTRYVGIAIWFVAAIIIHDVLIAPAVFVAGLVMRRLGRRIPPAVLAIVQGGIVIGAVFTIVLVPEILAQQYANLFPTLLPFDYVQNLGILWVGTLVLTALAVAAYVVWARAQARRSPR